MNGIRPQEILELVRAAEGAWEARDRWLVLGTVVSLDGSVYGRAGAMALFTSGPAERGGLIAAAEVGEALRREIEAAAVEGRPRLASLDVAEDDPILGYGLGAPGRVEIFLEPVDAGLRRHLAEVRQALLTGEGLVCGVEIEGPEAGRRRLMPATDPSVKECYQEQSPELIEKTSRGGVRRTFLCPLHPMGKVLIFGTGPIAAALARHLFDLGFAVYAADPRRGRLRTSEWDRSCCVLVEGGWEAARAAAVPDEETSVVALTRSYALDLEVLRGALQSPAAYVGLLGPLKRTQRLLAELEAAGIRPRPGVLCAPAGLDIGAEAPAEAALAIAAEILAARSGRRGGRLSPRRAPHAVVHHKPRYPGLVLAAGRGKRFAGGNKLTALLDGRAVLRHVVENALASRLDPVIVVLGCDAEEGLKTLAGLHDPRLRVVFNPLWEGGKASSIEVGLREVPFGAVGVVSLLGDMPRVKPWLIDRVLSEFELSGQLTFPVYPGPEGPVKGYPTAFPRELFGEIRALTGDDTAMEAVRRHWAEAVRIPLDSAETQADVDTAEDLQLLLTRDERP